jgi:predicted transcriptional regulator
MPKTGKATLIVRLKPEVKSNVANQEKMLGEIRQADCQIKSGHYVKHEDMKAWLLSWGRDRELPPPTCACGREHDDEFLCR